MPFSERTPKTRADRLALQRKQAEEQARLRAAEERRRNALAQHEHVLRDAERLVPEVLTALEAWDWPNSELITIKSHGRRRDRAGWRVGYLAQAAAYGDMAPTLVPCYLLSNGRFSMGGGAEVALRQIRHIPFETIRDALQQLLDDYS